jgi:opacity protein-like surface antigen
MKVTRKLIWQAIFVLALIAPQAAVAEWYGDVQLGVSFTNADNGGIMQNRVVTRPMESSDTSTPFGLRIGCWLANHPWLGFAGDVFLFTPNFNTPDMVDDLVLTVLPMSPLVLVRLTPASKGRRSAGGLTPYLGGGPSLFYTSMSEFAGASVPPPSVLEDSSVDLGWTGLAGITGFFGKRWSAILEYRYIQVSPSLSSSHPTGTLTFEPDLQTHHFTLGIRLHF